MISSTTLTRKVTGSNPGKDDFLKNFLFFTKQVLKDLWHTVMHFWSFGKYFFLNVGVFLGGFGVFEIFEVFEFFS